MSATFARGARRSMANVKKGQTVAPPEWWKHLRWRKRAFWQAQRKADKQATVRLA